MIFTIAIYSQYIQPFPMVNGWTGWFGGILSSIFVILDFGMGAACTKFYAEYRVHSRIKALKYAQIYTWWYLLITVGQAAIVLIFDLTVVPTSYIQYMSYFIIFSSFTRIPGMFGVMGLVLNAEQRFDVSITWRTILGTVINSFIVYGFVYLCRFHLCRAPAIW